MDTLIKYQLMNRAIEEHRENEEVLSRICLKMDMQGLTPETYNVQLDKPQNISVGRWSNMVKRFWKENYNG